VVIAFQPHTYSRTAAHIDEFAKELKRADICVLAEIYAARETNTYGVTSRDLSNKIPGSVFCPTPDDIITCLRKTALPGDLILTVGAGELNKVAERLSGGGM